MDTKRDSGKVVKSLFIACGFALISIFQTTHNAFRLSNSMIAIIGPFRFSSLSTIIYVE
jgi:hypothetical protein